MAIKINIKKQGIPVVLGDLEFLVGTTDADIVKYSKLHEEVQEEFEKVNSATSFEELHPVLKKGYDELLGEGTFEKVYAMNGSTIDCAEYLTAVYVGIFDELQKLTDADVQKNKIDKYLNRKK